MSVRLGEYDLSTSRDCITDDYGSDCADPPVNVEIEEQIAHELYFDSNVNKYHDIGLLRLKDEVSFTDFIKPICLPTTEEERAKTYTRERLDVAGWGRTETARKSNIKLKVKIPVVDFLTCHSFYTTQGKQIIRRQICAGGEKGRDSCAGDSGGPLMSMSFDKYRDPHWYAVGIVSMGPFPCGLQDSPGVYTKVSEYVKWVVRRMRP